MTNSTTQTTELDHATVHAAIKKHADFIQTEGFSPMETNEEVERTIRQELIKYDGLLPETVSMTLMMVLVVFELRRRQAGVPVIAH